VPFVDIGEPKSDSSHGVRSRMGPLTLDDVRIVDPTKHSRALKGAVVGNIIEWYEFGVFGFLIAEMGPVFLPESNTVVQSLYLFGIFAVTFVVRPVGGILLGWLGDRIGRRKVLTYTLLVMSVATLTTGLLPGYELIGVWAPILLIVVRLAQGFSASGEFTGAASFLGEHSPDRRRGRYVGLLAASTYIGFAMGAGIVGMLQLTTSPEFMQQWGWRIPFLVAGPLAGIALYFRHRVNESPAFAAILERRETTEKHRGYVEKNMSVVSVIRTQWRSIIPVIGIAASGNVVAYTMLSFAPTYLNQTLGFEGAEGSLILFPLYVAAAFIAAFSGALSDKIGRKPMLLVGVLIGGILAVPAFGMMGSGSLAAAVVGASFVMISSAIYSQSYASTLPEQFPTEARASALGLAYNVGNAAFGGTAPLVIGALVASTGDEMFPAFYLMGAAVVGLISLAFLKETSNRPLNGSLPNVETQEERRLLVATQGSGLALDPELKSLPYVSSVEESDGSTIEPSSNDPDVLRATEAAGAKVQDA
jgi:MHS family proline/betaine transporter-like MFS transporter